MLNWKLGLLLIVLTLAYPARAAAAGEDLRETLTYAEVERAYELHLPADYDGETPLPLVIALHPTASSGKAMAALTGLSTTADVHGFIVAYPDTYGLTWNEGRDELEGNNLDALTDDVGFIAALIDHLAEDYAVDTARVAITGMGNGGLFAYRLACEIPERLQSVIVVGSLMWAYHRDNCPSNPQAPVNILMIHGTNDAFYKNEDHFYIHPILGGPRRDILGVTSTLAVWTGRNGCHENVADDNSIRFTDCPAGGQVAFYNIMGGGHSWPRLGHALNQLGLDASEMLAAFISGSTDWAAPQTVLPTDYPRSYVVYVPENYTGADAMPLVIVLHGRYGTGAGMAQLTRLNDFADREGFIAVYPDGLGQNSDTGWNYTRGLPGVPDGGPDDTDFLDKLAQDLAVDLNIDQQRLYVVGFSNGGFMVERLACEVPERYAAFALVAATGYAGMPTLCAEKHPISILMMHGTSDTNVPWDGLAQTIEGQEIFMLAPVPNTLGFWANYSACSSDFESEDLPQTGGSPGTNVRVLRLKACADDVEVLLYAIIGGGHNWPGVPIVGPLAILGKVNLDIDATQVIWEFFARHTLVAADD